MIATRKYKSADEFLKDVSYGGQMYQKLCSGFVYRGLQSGSYELLPSILRHGLNDAGGEATNKITRGEMESMRDERWMMEDRDVIDALSAKDSIREEANRFTREVLVTPECEESVKI